MCGIVGLLLRDSSCDPVTLTRMRDLVTHRGPDDAGSYIDGPVGMGHRRLSIIDLGGGHQPMSTADGRLTIVYNGEIYNYRQLRRELEVEGAQFRTNSDTEVILQLHALRGDKAVNALNGIFAYALWDRDAHHLQLVRDRAGIKPLYYSVTPGGLAFGSEIKSLFASGLVAPVLDTRHVAEYLLFRQVAGPENLFRGVVALPPGHILDVTPAGIGQPRAYWRATDRPIRFAGNYADAIDAADQVLCEAVERQLMAEVPLGTFCSGGIDSSLITAVASQLSCTQINTFSVGFDEVHYDESNYARLAAKACGTRHHELRIGQVRFAELLPKLIWHHDLPLHFANSVHIFAVSELARQRVTVVLTGEGADELFGGYPRYSIPRITELLSTAPGALRRPIAALLKKLPDHRLRRIGSMLRLPLDDALLFNSTGISAACVERVLGQPLGDACLAVRRRLVEAARQAHSNVYGAVADLDFETYLVSILNRQDKMSMATSLEARVPFLDNAVIDLARALPQEFKQTLRHRKRVLKDVARRYLPREIVDRRKSGFGVPLPEWFRGTGPMSKLLDETAASVELTELVHRDRVLAVIAEHRSSVRDHSDLLWGLLNLGLWRLQYRC
jgi:asparagine synthase (glutamine-hydrolysing)